MYNSHIMNGKNVTAAVLVAILSVGQIAYGATEISEDIEGDITWTVANSPYIVTTNIGFSPITPGATLTIEPGVEVKFSPNASISIFGNLISKGDENMPIKFTSTEPDTAWRINIFDSQNSELLHIINGSTLGGIASYNSNIHARDLSGDSELMLFDGTSDLKDISFTNNRLFINGGSTIINDLNIIGGGASFFDTNVTLQNANISHTNSSPAIITSDRAVSFNNVYINNAEHGIIASNVPNLQLHNAVISNVVNNGLTFDGGLANLSNVSIENSYYGAGLQGSQISLDDLHINNIQAPALQVNADLTNISNSSFANGANTGVSVSGASAELQNVTITGFPNAPALLPSTASLHGQQLTLKNNLIGIYNYSSGTTTIRQSNISDNTQFGAIGSRSVLDARNNFWGHAAGPTTGDTGNPETIIKGDAVVGNVMYEPWLEEFCESACHSNIMFLPGIMSSRLYDGSEQLWEPGIFTRDREFEALYLDAAGKSIRDIHTKDVLDNGYAYGKLVEDLNELKAAGTINDYEAVPYDWRLSIEDILNTGTKREDGSIIYGSATSEPYIESALRRLAANSKSGKVTIIAHSNGGLVTKALINRLNSEASDLIDKVIFVAVPQLGTPQAIGALLHGYNAGQPGLYPFILSPERARDLAINMPMIYQLMPFADYYNSDGATIYTPYVSFEDSAATQSFIDKYGYDVRHEHLYSFLIGSEGRSTPAYDDRENPALANATLLAEAQTLQQVIDSSWTVPEGIEVHQIAGVGERTLAGIIYQTFPDCTERDFLFRCQQYDNRLTYYPNTVIDGDGTVVVPSALAMSTTSDSVKRWWLNLQSYNGATPSFLREQHSDILEVDELRRFIMENLLKDDLASTPIFISSSAPYLEQGNRLVFTLHSPLALSATDEHGNITNEQETSIPGATYTRYGEVQVITVPTGTKFTLVLTGEAEGSFTLEMEEFEGDDLVDISTFSAIPSSTDTLATIFFTDGSLENVGELQIDHNGDSIVDLTYTPILGETVTAPDPIAMIVERIILGGSSGGSLPLGRVLGVSDNTLTLEQLAHIVKQLHIVVTALSHLRGQIPEEQYATISGQVLTILSTLEMLLQSKS